MRRLVYAFVALGATFIALAFVGFYFYERPDVLRIAVPRGGEAYKLVVALAQKFTADRAQVRFKILPVSDLQAAAAALDADRADLAVVRSDIALPTKGQTALILAHDHVVLIAPHGATFSDASELRDKRVVVVETEASGEGNLKLLELIEAHYGLAEGSIRKKLAVVTELHRLLTSGEADAVLAIGSFSSPLLNEVVRSVTAVDPEGREPVFIAIPEAPAIAKPMPGLESTEILRGAFGGAPPRPASDVATLGSTLRLLAREDLANSLVGQLTRQVLADRASVAATAPLANQLETPSTDKGEALPTHPGAAAFIDGEEESFFDKYSDMIYVGAMIGSVALSAFATLASRLTVQGYARFDQFLERALTIVKEAREAEGLEALDDLEREIDAILTETLSSGNMPKLDAHQVAAVGLVIQQARLAINDRRRSLKAK